MLEAANFSMTITEVRRERSLKLTQQPRQRDSGSPSNQEFGRKCSEEASIVKWTREQVFVIRATDESLLEEVPARGLVEIHRTELEEKNSATKLSRTTELRGIYRRGFQLLLMKITALTRHQA